MRARALTVTVLFAGLFAAACGSDEKSSSSGGASSSTSGSSSSTGSGGSGGAGGGDPTPPNSCVKPGDKGNSKGIGEYCTKGGSECTAFAEAPFCLANFGQDQWFCTKIGCKMDADCGEDTTCQMDPMGSACVPNHCLGGTGGAGGMGGAGGGG